MKAIVAAIAAVLVGAAAVAICLLAPGYYAYLLGTLATTALVGVGLNILLGLAGEVSLGQGGFLALGAYGVGILTTKAGLNFWEALPLAVLLVGAISAVLSIPALRVTGPYLAMVTIAFGFIVESVSVEWRDLTGGSSGLTGIPAPFGTGGTALLACGLCVLALVAFHYFARSPLGLAMQAIASAPAAARGVGISALPVRTAAFVLAAVAAGSGRWLAGGADGFHRAKLISVLAVDPVSAGGGRRRRGPHPWAAGRFSGRRVLAGDACGPRGIPAAGFRRRVADRAVGGAGRDRGRRCASGDARETSPKPAPDLDLALAHIAGARGSLAAEGVRVAFGGVVAVAGVDMTAQPGRVTSVIGPNGAGKTTLLNLVSGFQRPDFGTVRVGGREITGQPAHEVARAGLARTFQTAQPFGGLSVLDNVRLGLLRGSWRGEASTALARALLSLVGYSGSETRLAATLPHVDRRLVEIARALGTAPSVLLLDEPAAGLNEADTVRLGVAPATLWRAPVSPSFSSSTTWRW